MRPSSMLTSVRASCNVPQNPFFANVTILVEYKAPAISMSSGTVASRVTRPINNREPQTISIMPTNGAMACGQGWQWHDVRKRGSACMESPEFSPQRRKDEMPANAPVRGSQVYAWLWTNRQSVVDGRIQCTSPLRNLQRGKKRRKSLQGPEHHRELRCTWRNGDGAMAQRQIGGTAANHRQSIAIEPPGHTGRHSWPGCISRESAGRAGQWSSHSCQRWFCLMEHQRALLRGAVSIFHHTFDSTESPQQIIRSLLANRALDPYATSFKSFHFVPASATTASLLNELSTCTVGRHKVLPFTFFGSRAYRSSNSEHPTGEPTVGREHGTPKIGKGWAAGFGTGPWLHGNVHRLWTSG